MDSALCLFQLSNLTHGPGRESSLYGFLTGHWNLGTDWLRAGHERGLLTHNSLRAQNLQPPFYLPPKVRIFWVMFVNHASPSHRLFSPLKNHSTVNLLLSSNLIDGVPRFRQKQGSGLDGPWLAARCGKPLNCDWLTAWVQGQTKIFRLLFPSGVIA